MKPEQWLSGRRAAEWLARPFSRRSFLKLAALAAAWLGAGGGSGRRVWAAAAEPLPPRPGRKPKTDCRLAVAVGEDPAALTRKAVEALGGMERFVRRGDVVVVKPNIGWDRTPEQAGNTNPFVVAELVTLARAAGAKRVKVFDNTCNDPRRTYARSGIAEAAKAAGAEVSYVSEWKFQPGAFPAGAAMSDWPIYRDAAECDVFINVPVAKHHGLTDLTLSIKNLMGICGGGRGRMHWGIEDKLAEVAAFIKPDLTVIDAYRILLRNGPTGGDLADVRQARTVIASADPVLADAYAAGLFDRKPDEIGYIRAAAKQGLGSPVWKPNEIRKLTV